MPTMPNGTWIPDAVLSAAKELSAEIAAEPTSEIGLAILSRLVSDHRMTEVFRYFYEKKRDDHENTGEYLHPAAVTMRTIAKRRRTQAATVRAKGSDHEARLLEAVAAAEENLPILSTLEES